MTMQGAENIAKILLLL